MIYATTTVVSPAVPGSVTLGANSTFTKGAGGTLTWTAVTGGAPVPPTDGTYGTAPNTVTLTGGQVTGGNLNLIPGFVDYGRRDRDRQAFRSQAHQQLHQRLAHDGL